MAEGRIIGGMFKITIGKFSFSLQVHAEAMQRMADSLKRAGDILRNHAAECHRENWWKRSDQPPEWIAEVNEPEWWNDGQPPDWGCAA